MAARECSQCGRPYYRSNRFRLWTKQNPGHRTGWAKWDEPVCLNCQPAGQAQRILALATVRIVHRKRAAG